MSLHPVELQIAKADRAINEEDLEAVMSVYSEDAVLVVRPGLNAVGKPRIREAMAAIAAYFKHGLVVKQDGMTILEAGDTALVLARTVISAPNTPTEVRSATYVFNRAANGDWLCVIDNSYGHAVIDC